MERKTETESKAETNSAATAAGKGRIDIETKLKLLRAAGIKIVPDSSEDFGGMTIIGAPIPPPEEEDTPK